MGHQGRAQITAKRAQSSANRAQIKGVGRKLKIDQFHVLGSTFFPNFEQKHHFWPRTIGLAYRMAEPRKLFVRSMSTFMDGEPHLERSLTEVEENAIDIDAAIKVLRLQELETSN